MQHYKVICPVEGCGKTFDSSDGKSEQTVERALSAHLLKHWKKQKTLDLKELKKLAKREVPPLTDEAGPTLEEFAKKLSEVLPTVVSVKPKRPDPETLTHTVTELCKNAKIKIQCPECGAQFVPGERNEARTV